MSDTESGRGSLLKAAAVGFVTFMTAIVLYTVLDVVVTWGTDGTGAPTNLPATVAAIVLVCALFAGVVAFVITLGATASPPSYADD